MDLSTVHRISTTEALRALIGEPQAVVCSKITDQLNELTRVFIERSPFVCLATTDADGRCDLSPRGDPAGFVRILDERTLLIPERPGNKIADSLRNVIETGRIGLLFILPGVGETFRVNGRAWLTDDAALLRASELEGKLPKLGIVIEIEEAYTQCPKAFLRSHLWDPTRFQTTDGLASGGEILKRINAERDPDFDAAAYDAARAARYARREGFY
jgi:uncharacterized protein